MKEQLKEKIPQLVVGALLGYHLLFIATGTTEASSPSESMTPAAALLKDINQYRESMGLHPLNENEKLDQIAQRGVQDMSEKNYRSHTSPSGETIFTRLMENDVKYKRVGEIIAWNGYPPQDSEQVAFKAFIKNTPHRDIIEGNYTEIGTASISSPEGEIFEAELIQPENTKQQPYIGKGPYTE